jgi:hypothetical protein
VPARCKGEVACPSRPWAHRPYTRRAGRDGGVNPPLRHPTRAPGTTLSSNGPPTRSHSKALGASSGTACRARTVQGRGGLPKQAVGASPLHASRGAR